MTLSLLSVPARAQVVNAAASSIIESADAMVETDERIREYLPRCNRVCSDDPCAQQREADCGTLDTLVQQQRQTEDSTKQAASTGLDLGALSETLLALASMAATDTTGESVSFASDPVASVAALEQAGLTAGQARRAVQAAVNAEQIENSGLLDQVRSSGRTPAAGRPSLAKQQGGGAFQGAPSGGKAPKKKAETMSESPKETYPNIGKVTHGGGGGGSSLGRSSRTPNSLPPLGIPPKPKKPVAKPKLGPHTHLNGEKIGVSSQNIFEKLSQRYRYHVMANSFIND